MQAAVAGMQLLAGSQNGRTTAFTQQHLVCRIDCANRSSPLAGPLQLRPAAGSKCCSRLSLAWDFYCPCGLGLSAGRHSGTGSCSIGRVSCGLQLGLPVQLCSLHSCPDSCRHGSSRQRQRPCLGQSPLFWARCMGTPSSLSPPRLTACCLSTAQCW